MVMLIRDLDVVKVLLRSLVLKNFQLVSVRFWHYAFECAQVLARLEVNSATVCRQVKNFLCGALMAGLSSL